MTESIPAPPLPVIIDTDPGVDDALALIFALRSGLFEVRAITVVAGNCHVDQAVENTFRILNALAGDFVERDITWTPPPVYRGMDKPQVVEPIDALHVHGLDGLGDICSLTDERGAAVYPLPSSRSEAEHAVDAMIDAANRAPGEITLITLGPMTNVAHAVQRDPGFPSKLRRMVSMAGAFRTVGNVTPAAEYNVWADPEACRIVLEAFGESRSGDGEGSINLVFVGLDVTHSLPLRGEVMLDWIGDAPRGLPRFLKDCTVKMVEFHVKEHGWSGMYLHDPLPVLYAACPDLCGVEEMQISIECRGEFTRGMTVADLRDNRIARIGVPAQVCTTVKAEAALELFRLGVFGDPSEIPGAGGRH
jgi:purine nucleosidase/pyrimidine-specific ribonucleoside hydrolase